jgi:DNA-binding response OmpR family regulator
MTRVLAIDRDRAAGSAIRSLLETEGFEVVLVDSHEAGVRAIDASAFDAVIIDVFLPGVEGLDIIAIVRERAPMVPIIAIAPRRLHDCLGPEQDFLGLATKVGAAFTFYKPFMPRDFITAVASCLEHGGRRQRGRGDSSWFRGQATQCAALAENATDPLIKEFNQAQADRWLRLAEVAERQGSD